LNYCRNNLRNIMKHKVKYSLLLLFAVTLFSFGQKQGQVDQRLLVGEWSRTETPCQIKITEVLDNGKLELTYFNLKLINTGKTYWLIKGTFLSLYIELLDENNPGSYYKLNYNVERDVLVGDYFEVIDGITYPVEFVRTKQ
jgi:hypothetical protein